MTTRKYSYCRNCAAYCGTQFEVADNKIVSHRADKENAFTEGFMCIKGELAVDFHKGVEPRLVECLKRGPDGKHHPIAASALMDEAAEKLCDLIERHGPRSVALFYGTSGYAKSLSIPMAKDFMAKIASPNLFSTMTIDQSAHWVAEGRLGIFTTGRPPLGDLDVILMSGTNPIVSHGSVYTALPTNNQTKHLRAFKAKGGRMIIIDPRRTETAAQADIHIQPRPGFDTEIYAALIRLVLENGWHNAEFCARYITNLDALRTAVAPFTPDLVAARAGIEADQLIAAARMLGEGRRAHVSFGTGTTMAPHPNTAAHMAYALNAICGGFLRAGDTLSNPGIFVKKSAVEGVIPPRRSWEAEPKLPSGYGQVYGEFPSSQLPSEILRNDEPRIRALIVIGGNPMIAMGSPDVVRKAFESLELLIVLDPRLTETARRAHYVVAPPLQYEVHDSTILTDFTSEKPFVQYAQPVIDPPPGVLEEWKFFNGVANRLGKVLGVKTFGFGGGGGSQAAGLALAPDRDWQTRDLIEWYCGEAGISLEDLRAHPHGYQPDLPIPVVQKPATDDGARLDACPADVAHELAQVLREQDEAGQKYRLVSRRIIEVMNSAYRHSPRTQTSIKTNRLYMNPADMTEDDLADGDIVNITGSHGRIVGYVKRDATMRRGVVSMTHCFGLNDAAEDPEGLRGAHTGRLVSMAREDVQPIDGMPLQSAIPVDIAKRALSNTA